MATRQALEPGTSPIGHWLRERRIRLSAWVALVESLVVAIEVIGGRSVVWTSVVMLVIAVVVTGFYVVVGRTLGSEAARQLSWIAAASQAFAIVVLILLVVLKWLVLLAVAALAVTALLFLVADRR